MSEYTPFNANRLLELEQQLLGQRRLAEMMKRRQNKQESLKKAETPAEIPDAKLLSKNRLLALEQELLQLRRLPNNSSKLSTENTEEKTQAKKRRLGEAQPKASPVQSQVFDTGEAIFLEYNASFYQPTSINPVEDSLIFHLQNDEVSFQVESFEAVEESQEINVLDNKTVSQNDISLEEILTELRSKLVGDNQKSSPHHSVTESPCQSQTTTYDKTDLTVTPKTDFLENQQSNTTYELAEKSASETSETPENEVFAADIQAILNGEINTQPEKPLIQKPQETQQENERHAIFDQMGINMAFANSFDLGTVELEMQFDEFDRILEEQENQSNNSVSEELTLRFDEFDRALDKAENPLPSLQCFEIPDFLEQSGLSVPHSSKKGCNLAEQESTPEVAKVSEKSEDDSLVAGFPPISHTHNYTFPLSKVNVNPPLEFHHEEPRLIENHASNNFNSSKKIPELNLGMRMLLLLSCLKFISYMMSLIKFLFQTEVIFQGLTPRLKKISQPREEVDDIITNNSNSKSSTLVLPEQKSSNQIEHRK